jgi:hypothetical protein
MMLLGSNSENELKVAIMETLCEAKGFINPKTCVATIDCTPGSGADKMASALLQKFNIKAKTKLDSVQTGRTNENEHLSDEEFNESNKVVELNSETIKKNKKNKKAE